MAEKLLPCPFCGRKPKLGKGFRRKREFKFVDGSVEEAGAWLWKPRVKCVVCKFEREFESVEEAAAWWNKRA